MVPHLLSGDEAAVDGGDSVHQIVRLVEDDHAVLQADSQRLPRRPGEGFAVWYSYRGYNFHSLCESLVTYLPGNPVLRVRSRLFHFEPSLCFFIMLQRYPIDQQSDDLLEGDCSSRICKIRDGAQRD